MARVTAYFPLALADYMAAEGIQRERRINDIRLAVFVFALGLSVLTLALRRNLAIFATDQALMWAGLAEWFLLSRLLARPLPRVGIHFMSVGLDLLLATAFIISDAVLAKFNTRGAQFDPNLLWYFVVAASGGMRFLRSLSILTGVAVGLLVLGFYAFDSLYLKIALDPLACLITLTAMSSAGYLMYRTVHGSKQIFARGVRHALEKDYIKSAFSRYVTKEVVEEILKGNINVTGGIRREVTILFSDIRGFTAMAENLSPEEVVSVLNEYFEAMVEAIFTFGGTVDKYMGDGIMAIFGAPIPHADHAFRAVQAAQAMREALVRLNDRRRLDGAAPLEIGIGLHSGDCVVGNIGALDRFDYTAVGDTVNTASRIEGITKDLGADILLSGSTYRMIADRVDASPMPAIPVRGKAAPLAVYHLLGVSAVPVAGG